MTAIHHRRLERLIKIVNTKLGNLSESPLGSYFTLFYPDNAEHLSDAELKKIAETIENNFELDNGDSFQILLRTYVEKKNITACSMYSNAMIEKSYYYQILKGRRPSRDVAIRLSLALKLDLYEAIELLRTVGYTFFEKCRRDIIIMECVKHKTGLYTAEILLDKYGEASLCNKSILHRK